MTELRGVRENALATAELVAPELIAVVCIEHDPRCNAAAAGENQAARFVDLRDPVSRAAGGRPIGDHAARLDVDDGDAAVEGVRVSALLRRIEHHSLWTARHGNER